LKNEKGGISAKKKKWGKNASGGEKEKKSELCEKRLRHRSNNLKLKEGGCGFFFFVVFFFLVEKGGCKPI